MLQERKEISAHLQHTAEVIEFSRVVEYIANKCVSYNGKQIARNLSPIGDIELIRARQEIIEEIRRLLSVSSQPDLTGFSEVEVFIGLAMKDGILSQEELWAVTQVSSLCSRLLKIARDKQSYPRLRNLLDGISDTLPVHSNIMRLLVPPGVLRDDATEKLVQLKNEKKVVHDKLIAKLESMLGSTEFSQYWQEPIITIRNGRFVLPIKIEHKNHIPSVIHDRSESGATVFVEPIEVIPMNNQIRELELEEQAERRRIFRNLSAIVSAYGPQLLDNIKILHYLDFLVACAHFADEFKCNFPHTSPDAPLNLVDAKNPILLIEWKDNERVVPLNIELQRGKKCIIITGPNMGGKTVALKTIGLACMMASCGLPIPADVRSSVPLFTKFFADIGDEQSTEASISSFASHIIHWNESANDADDRSLVLLDELGSATDPDEGTALSFAFVENLLNKGATVIATTHLGGLMGLSNSRNDTINASMEFDIGTMSPTYRMLVDVPGRSWAMEIAERLNLPSEILARAKQLRGSETLNISSLISELQKKLREIDDLRKKIVEETQDIRLKREFLEELISSNTEKQKELARLKKIYEFEKDDKIASAIERELNKIRDEWNQIIAQKPPERETQKSAENFINKIKARLRQAEKISAQKRGVPKNFEKGQRVYIWRLRQWGEVIEATDENGFVKVLVGRMNLRIHSSGVDSEEEYRDRRRKKVAEKKGGVSYKIPKVPDKLDIRGMQQEDAWDTIDRALDNAIVAEIREILIIHGKGTGTLRRFVRDKLRSDKRVSQLKLPPNNLGGDGATIAVITQENPK